MGELERLRAGGLEVGIEQADVAQVLQLGPIAGEDVEADEVGGLGGVLLVVGRLGRDGNRDFDKAIVGHGPGLDIVHRGMGGMGVAGKVRGVAIPLLHLGEEAQQIGLGAVVLTALGQQDAGGQRGVQAEHQRIAADGGRRSLGAQQPGGFQRGQPALNPGGLIGREQAQGMGGAGIGQDGAAQGFGMAGLLGDELAARQRGHGAQGIEAERHGRPFGRSDMLLGVGREKLGGQALGDAVQPARAGIQDAGSFPFRVQRVEFGAQAVEVVVDPFGQAGVGLHLEAGTGKAVGGQVNGIAGGQVPAPGVGGAVQCGPGQVGAHAGGGRVAVGLGVGGAGGHRAIGLAAHIGGEDDIGQVQACQHIPAVAHVGGADIEAQVGRIDIAQALQADAVQRRVARLDLTRAADADGGVGLDHAFDQVAVGLDHPLAVRVADDHVVQAQGHMAQIEHRPDVGGIQHLPAFGLDLELTRACQLDQGAGGESCTLNVHADPAVVVVAHAALVGRDPGDGQRQQIGAQRHGAARIALARAQQDVVVARLGAGHQQGLVGRDGLAVGDIKVARRGHLVPADIDLVGAGGRSRIEQHAQGLAGGHADLVDPGLFGRQRGGQALTHSQRGHRDLQGRARGAAVVGLARGQMDAGVGAVDLAFEDLVVEVGPHDHAPGAVLERGQPGLEAGAVAGIGAQIAKIACVGHLAQGDVGQIPAVVGGQVERVGPAAVGGVEGGVADREADLDLIADLGAGRHHDIGDHQVGRRRGLDAQGLRRRSAVVVVPAELGHLAGLAAAPDAGGVGHHEDVVGPCQLRRCREAQAAGVAGAGAQAAAVLHIAEVAVFAEIQQAVLGQVDHVVPAALVSRGLAAQVVNLVVDREALAGDHGLGCADRSDLQVGWRGQGNRQGDLGDVVGLVLELRHAVAAALGNDGQAGADGARHAGLEIREDAGVGLDDQPEVTTDRGRDRKAGALGVVLAGLQKARPALVVGQLDPACAQQLFDFAAVIDQRVVAWVEGGVARQVDTVEPARHPRGAAAPVADRPGGGEGVARAGLGLVQRDAVDLQVGLAVGDVELADAEVVAARGAFEGGAGVVGVAGVGVAAVDVGRRRGAELVLRLLDRIRTLSCAERWRQAARQVLAVGDDVEVVGAIGACRQRDDRAGGVAFAGTQRRAVAVHDRADLGGTLGNEAGVGADPEVVQPALGAGPDGGAKVLHRPGDGAVLAREVVGQGGDLGDPQIGRRIAHH